MFEEILPYLRCPACSETPLHAGGADVSCRACGARFPIQDGILDLLCDAGAEVITPFQRIMQTPVVVSIYERMWRRLGYFIASSRPFAQEVHTILRLGQGRASARILDLACGTGIFTRPLARAARGIVVGLDMSWPMLRHAQRLLARDGIRNVCLLRGSAFRLPFMADAFPYINCCGALHLFDKPEVALKEIARVLHRGGHLSVQTTIRPRHSGGMAYVLERFIRFGFFNESELLELLRLHGLKVVESERHRISCTFLARR
jgi:SAM-dependent methyltransferase/uncharacterized protein YbaR (Trm112 family)